MTLRTANEPMLRRKPTVVELCSEDKLEVGRAPSPGMPGVGQETRLAQVLPAYIPSSMLRSTKLSGANEPQGTSPHLSHR